MLKYRRPHLPKSNPLLHTILGMFFAFVDDAAAAATGPIGRKSFQLSRCKQTFNTQDATATFSTFFPSQQQQQVALFPPAKPETKPSKLKYSKRVRYQSSCFTCCSTPLRWKPPTVQPSSWNVSGNNFQPTTEVFCRNTLCMCAFYTNLCRRWVVLTWTSAHFLFYVSFVWFPPCTLAPSVLHRVALYCILTKALFLSQVCRVKKQYGSNKENSSGHWSCAMVIFLPSK